MRKLWMSILVALTVIIGVSPTSAYGTSLKSSSLSVAVATGSTLSSGIPLSSSQLVKTDIFLQINPPKNSKLLQFVLIDFVPNNSIPIVTVQLRVLRTNCIWNNKFTPCYEGKWSFTPKQSGNLRVRYLGDKTFSSSIWQKYIEVSSIQRTRVITDQPDDLTGYQVHAVYVVPSDVKDNKRDTTGQISDWLTLGSKWLDSQVGDHWQVDSFNNYPDATFLKSKYSLSYLLSNSNGMRDLLMKEMNPAIGTNRKTYLFFLETPNLADNAGSTGSDSGTVTCGLAGISSNSAVIATGSVTGETGCSGTSGGIPEQAITAIHETLHTLGVEHVVTPNDIMTAVLPSIVNAGFDKLHTQYFRGSGAGQDVSLLRIWSHALTDPNRVWPCSYDYDKFTYYCPVGISPPTDAYLAGCWADPVPDMTLEVSSGSQWIPVRDAVTKNSTICSTNNPYWFSVVFTGSAQGTVSYRFHSVANQYLGDPFTVVYQN